MRFNLLIMSTVLLQISRCARFEVPCEGESNIVFPWEWGSLRLEG